MGFTIVGIGLAASGIASGIMGAGAAKSAGGQQADALRQALAFQQGVYGDSQHNLAPFISGGTNALASLSQLYGLPAPAGTSLPAGNALDQYSAFTKTPFYQFPMSQGIEALNRSGAAHGLTLSGGQANALQKYGADYASGNFQSYINALAGLANLGQSSAVSLGGQGNQAASNVTGIQTGVGNALAAGTIGSQNQLNKALESIPALLGAAGGPTGSAYNGLASGVGNVLSGYSWDGMATGSRLGGLTNFANSLTSGGGAGI